MNGRPFVVGALVLSLVAGAAPARAQATGGKDVVITVFDADTRPMAGVEVKVFARKDVRIKGVITQGITDENGRLDLTAARGKAVPTSTITQGAGLRFVASHAKWEPATSEVWSDELLYTADAKEVEIYLRTPLRAVRSWTFARAEVAPAWRGGTPGRRATEKELVLADAASGERAVFAITSPPPAELASGAEFTVKAQASIANPRSDFILQLCWTANAEGAGLDCTTGFSGAMPYVGVNSETRKVTPAATSEIAVKVPAQFSGDQPRLVFRIGTALGLEPTFAEWMSWTYAQK